jgi:SAM-dependent methyltransferase
VKHPVLSANAWLRWDVVQQLLPAEARTVLEVGCGQGAMGTRIAATTDYLGVEPDATSFSTASARIAALGRGEVRQGYVETSVEPGRTFDLVCSFEVIEHIDDDAALLKSWVELVRPGGWVLLSTPAFTDRYGPWDAIVGHFRRYDPPVLAQLLHDAGLVDTQVRVYGAGLGIVLEKARNIIGARRLRAAGIPIPQGPPADADLTTMAALTSGSGRLFQPPAVAGVAMQVATAPFRVLQRRFPSTGTGLVAIGRVPAQPADATP